MCLCFARQFHTLHCIAYVLYQSFVPSTLPRGQGGRQRGKCVAFFKNNIASHRAAEQGKCLISCFDYTAFLAHLNQSLIGELIVYPWSGVRRRPSVVRRSQCSNMSKTIWPIKAKFYDEPLWIWMGNERFAACGSHDQDGRHANI